MKNWESKANTRVLMFLAASLFFAYLLPYHVYPFATFYNEWLAVFGIVIAFAYCVKEKTIFVQVPWITMIPLGMAVAITLQALSGMLNESSEAIIPIAYLLVASLAILLGASMAKDKNDSWRLCLSLASAHLFAGIISVAIATLQYMGAEFGSLMMYMSRETGEAIRPHANIGQPNQLALLFCISLASAWWLFQVERLKINSLIAIVLMLLWGLVLTQSRIGWIIVPAFAFACWFWRGNEGFRVIPNGVLVGLIVTYLALVLTLPTISSLLGVVTNSAAERLGGTSIRLVLFQQALEISFSYPWFGAGWGQFGPQQLAFATNFPQSLYSRHAHNIVLNFAAELGWPITVLIFCGLSYWFCRICLFRPITKQVAFAILFFIAVLVHSLVEYPLWYAFVLLPFALLVGMVHQEQIGSAEIRLSRKYIMAALVVLMSGSVGIAMDYRRVVAGFLELEFGSAGLGILNTVKEKPVFTAFPYMFDYFRFVDTIPRLDMSEDEIAFMERVSRRFGAGIVLARMSQIYALNGRQDDAVKSMLTIQRLHPHYYRKAYEEWSYAPKEYKSIFNRLPPPS